MLNLKFELEKKEVDFILEALNEVPVKGFQAHQFILIVANKLQNPLNKKEYDEAQAAENAKKLNQV